MRQPEQEQEPRQPEQKPEQEQELQQPELAPEQEPLGREQEQERERGLFFHRRKRLKTVPARQQREHSVSFIFLYY
ncbi:MAG: hypothetical protein HZC43_13110 [Nitrosomonadales bacterium]|nr:hypothetical protein [Nitrosomonadales bacterium]